MSHALVPTRRSTAALVLAATLSGAALTVPAAPARAAQVSSSCTATAADAWYPAGTQTCHRHDRLGSGARHMASEVTWLLPAPGGASRLVGSTRTWTDVKATGFTGSLVVLFKGAHGETVGYSDVVAPFGVDGRWIGRWSRTDHWSLDVPAEMTRGAVGFEVAHSRGSVDRTREQARRAKEYLSIVSEVLGWFNG